MRNDEVSTSFGIHVLAVLQQFCYLFTVDSFFHPGQAIFTGQHGSPISLNVLKCFQACLMMKGEIK